MKKKYLFAVFCIPLLFSQCIGKKDGMIMTVNGPVASMEMGVALTHEHILVDFIGADSISEKRWDKLKVAERALPFLKEIKARGCQTFIECTPAFLGRDPLLLKSLSDASGLNIITNTGYYGAINNRYIPQHAYQESADQLAARWIQEFKKGIDGTGIKPGFIKISVADGNLSGLHMKMVVAAARAHLKTGLSIASHTGPAIPAFEQLDVLQSEGVAPEAFIWVHAQAEKDPQMHIKAARMGAWISLDGLNENNLDDYINMIKKLKGNNLLSKVLLSHDSGYYRPGEDEGGDYRGYTTIFDKLIPRLRQEGFTESDINQILVINSSEAFKIEVHKISQLPV